jgi:hypothetical protein
MTYAYVDGLSDVELAALELAIEDEMEYFSTEEQKSKLAKLTMIVNDCCIERHIDRDALYGEEFDKAYDEMRCELHQLKK